ncbi:MAG: LysR family transcriptional regulator [Eubacterium sp.]|nr:LysR family transcriptional regulator [Eubacterium sp.]
MIKQIKYFQAVIKYNSFTKAAEECYISQSAISQQISALENELGVTLLQRNGRKFSLTPAGEYFYKSTLGLVNELELICSEAKRIANDRSDTLSVGYLKSYDSTAIQLAFAEFAERYPEVNISITSGNHEKLYHLLIENKADIVLNDQRRAFNKAYNNLILRTSACNIEISSRHPIAQLESVEPFQLKDMPCILVASEKERENERDYYRDYIGIKSDFVFAETTDEARMLVAGGRGYFPAESEDIPKHYAETVTRVPLTFRGEALRKNYCAFWDKQNKNPHIEAFIKILQQKF